VGFSRQWWWVFLGSGGGGGGGVGVRLGLSDGGCLSLKRAERWMSERGSSVLVAFDFFVLS
jgi:hypothetical protein